VEPLTAVYLIICLITSLLTVYLVSRSRNERILTIDAHKPGKVTVPKIGGVCLLSSGIVALSLDFILHAAPIDLVVLVEAPAIVVGVVGLLDDVGDVSPMIRILVSILVSIILVILVHPYSSLLLIGTIRNIIFLDALACLMMIIMFNAVNMLDIMNGIVSGGSLIVFIGLFIITLIRSLYSFSLIYLLLIMQVLPLFMFNKYPARVLLGNVGSYMLGTYIGVTACYCGTFVETLLLCLPFIINGLLIVASTRGRVFVGGRKRASRPILCREGFLYPNPDPAATLSLARIFVIYGCTSEKDVVKNILMLFIISLILTIAVSLIFYRVIP